MWFYFIGKTKLNLTFKETGRLTLYMFNKLYQHYKDDWDLEMLLFKSNRTYKEIKENQNKNEYWIK